MNSNNISNLKNIQNFQTISNSRNQSYMESMTNGNSMNISTTNILLNNDNIFTSPAVAFTNRNNVISTTNINLSSSVLENSNNVFKLPEPYVSKDIISDSNFKHSNTNNNIENKNKLVMLEDGRVAAMSSTSLINQLQGNIENEQFAFNHISTINENNSMGKEEVIIYLYY